MSSNITLNIYHCNYNCYLQMFNVLNCKKKILNIANIPIYVNCMPFFNFLNVFFFLVFIQFIVNLYICSYY